jgi:hypothetical protein
MQLSFSWNEDRGVLSPHCESNAVNVDGICLLALILLDDGGCGHAHSIHWLDEGLEKIDSVSSGESSSVNWDRETWGATLKRDEVTIYSLHDESCFQQFSLRQFHTAIVAWESFIQKAPSLESAEQIEI